MLDSFRVGHSNNETGYPRTDIMRLFVALILALHCALAAATITLPAASTIPTRTAGRAPLAVLFDASATKSTATSIPFHEVEYRWNFGDPGSGAWQNGALAGTLSKNEARGPIAAHLFEAPGTYRVTLIAFDGQATAQTTMTITVSAWPADGTTMCVSTSGASTGCPAGATQKANTSSFTKAMGYLTGKNTRLLFRCGERWRGTRTFTLDLDGPGMIGAYNDSGVVTASNPCRLPSVNYSGSPSNGIIELGGTSAKRSDWRIADLIFDGQSNAAVKGILNTAGSSVRGFDQLTVLRVTLKRMSSPFELEPGGGFANPNRQIFIVDSTVQTVIGGDGSVGIWWQAENSALLGSKCDDSTAAEHCVRLQYLGTGVVSNNTFRNAAALKANFSLRAPCRQPGGGCNFISSYFADKWSEKVVVSDNYSEETKGNDHVEPMQYKPENKTSDERLRNIISERNHLKLGAGGETMHGVDTCELCTVRGNILDAAAAGPYRKGIEVDVTKAYAGQISDKVYVYNNAIYTSGGRELIAIRGRAGVTNMTVKNNAGYAPTTTTRAMVADDTGSGSFTSSNNSTDTQLQTTPPFASATPSAPADFRPAGYAVAGGAPVPVWADFFRRAWPNSANRWDIGAATVSPSP